MISFFDVDRLINESLFGQWRNYTLVDEGNNPIIGFKSMLKAEYKSSGKTVFEPIEENSFATYNKTTEPREFYFELALQFPYQDFGIILGKLEELKKGTDLFSFITPFNAYSDLTLEGYATTMETTTSMLIVGLQCKEVIQVAQGYTNVTVNDATPIGSQDSKNPDGVDTSDTGMTGTNPSSEEEKKQTRESILHTGIGKRIPGTRRQSGSGGGGDFS